LDKGATKQIGETSDGFQMRGSENLITAMSRIQDGFRNTVMLQLKPPELGNVLVHVHRSNEQLSASFWLESSEARVLLQTHLPALRDSLAQLGHPNQQIALYVVSDDAFGQLFSHSAYQQQPTSGYSSHDQGRRNGNQRNSGGFENFKNEDADYQQIVDIFI
jgi:flagellar hook-length control protein FliK